MKDIGLGIGFAAFAFLVYLMGSTIHNSIGPGLPLMVITAAIFGVFFVLRGLLNTLVKLFKSEK